MEALLDDIRLRSTVAGLQGTRPKHNARETGTLTSVLDERDITALLHDARLAPPVLSVYLDANLPTGGRQQLLGTLRSLLTRVERTLRGRDAARERLTRVITPALADTLEREVAPLPTVRGVAVFASLGAHNPAVHTVPLPRPVRSQAHVGPRPVVRPLLLLLDQYERYVVIVADRRHARVCTLFLGEIEQQAEASADTPTRHQQGGWSQMRFQRHVDDHVAQHIRHVARIAREILTRLPPCRIILGGSDEIVPLLRETLGRADAHRIVGTFPLDVHASLHTIRERALAIARMAEARGEAARVQRLRDALAHRQGCAGLEDTLRALTEKRVHSLLVQQGWTSPGALCENCGALLVPTGPCAYCHARTTAVADIVASAVERAHEEAAHIEFVVESMDLEALGHIGALFRYPAARATG